MALLNMKRMLRSWEKLTDSRRKSLLSDYRIDFITNEKSEIYIIDEKTMSGFQIDHNLSITVILSGVDYFQYYRTNDSRVTMETELKRVFDNLVRKEAINKDRMYNVIMFLEDVATLDRVGN